VVRVTPSGPESIAVILNPRAGSAGADAAERIAAALSSAEITELAPGDLPGAAVRRALARGARTVVAAGGDGTVSAVAAELVGGPARLGIVPCGTANPIAAALGIPDAIADACATIEHGHVRRVDSAMFGERPFLLMATIGLHARAVTEASDGAKAVFGPLAYVTKGVELLLGAEPFAVELTIDGASEPMRASVHALTVANMAPARTFLAQGPPEVCADDGLLDVTLVAFDGVLDALATSLHLFRNALEGLPADRDGVAFLRARRVAVRANPQQRLMIDGELAGSTPFEVWCRPGALAVLAPSEPARPPG
jgi:YegS/Rv2252/BmrU family lipid kinase